MIDKDDIITKCVNYREWEPVQYNPSKWNAIIDEIITCQKPLTGELYVGRNNHKKDIKDILDAARYSTQMGVYANIAKEDEKMRNLNQTDISNLIVWDRKNSKPIGRVTGMTIEQTSREWTGLKIDAVLFSENDNLKIKYNDDFYGVKTKAFTDLRIKRVIFNDPATIVFWKDGTKTVVKAHNELFDPEKGLAMAVCKKLYGDKYHRLFKDHIPEEFEPDVVFDDQDLIENILNNAKEAINNLNKELNAGKEQK